MCKFICPLVLACLAVGIVCFGTGGGEPETPSTVVTTDLDVCNRTDGLISLREAISYAAEGDTVTFGEMPGGTIIELRRGSLKIDKGLTVDASSVGPMKFGGVTIDGRGTGRVFTVAVPPGGGGVELIGLVVVGGKEKRGGGIYVDRSALTLTHVTVADNYAEWSGGGIYIDNGLLTAANSTIIGNTSFCDGGGICSDRGELTVADSTVAGNSAKRGGGICNWGKSASIINTRIVGNVARYRGGGIDGYAGALTVADSTVAENFAGSGGGGIFSDSHGQTTIANSTILRNSAGSGGGGIRSDTNLSITGSTISKNSSNWDGGGFCNYGTLSIDGSTISDNSSEQHGGGGYSTKSLTLRNTTVLGNTAPVGGGLSFGGGLSGSDPEGTLSLVNVTVAGNTARRGGGITASGKTEMFNSIVALNDSGDIVGHFADRISGTNNMIGGEPGFAAAPVFEEGKLANADALDLSLLEGSAAIDAGSNDAAEAETDLAGNPRIAGAAVDLGAYEYQGNPDAAESAEEPAEQPAAQ